MFDDHSTCWHGSGIYEDCNNKLWSRNLMIRYYGGNCKWWHFYPSEGTQQLEEKFNEIVRGNTENVFVSGAINAARSLMGRKL